MKPLSLSYPTISASVSCMDLLHLESQIRECESAGVSFFHYDIVDGDFNQCFILGDTLLEQMASFTKLPIEVHLAAFHPEMHIERIAKCGADYIAVPYETDKDPRYLFEQIRKWGARPVLCYRADTAPDKDFLSLAKEVAWILKLTVQPGFSGQTLQPQAIEHIRSMRIQLDAEKLSTPIQADGNVNLQTISLLSKAGANIFTGGSSGLFTGNDSLKNQIDQLVRAANL